MEENEMISPPWISCSPTLRISGARTAKTMNCPMPMLMMQAMRINWIRLNGTGAGWGMNPRMLMMGWSF